MHDMNLDAEVAIIGAGPIGIELAIALKKYGMSYIQFDKGQVGQMIYNFPPQTRFFSSSERLEIGGMPIQTTDQQKCTREEYLAYLRSCVMQQNLQIHTFEEVIDVRKNQASGKFEIETLFAGKKRFYMSSYIVFSTGGTAKSRMLEIPGENLPHVSTKMQDPHLYFQKEISIIGSRNSAVEWSLRCFHAGAKVTLICRREAFDVEHVKYWLLPELNGLVKEGHIHCMFNSQVIEIHPDKIKVSNPQKFVSEIPADFVIKAIGFFSDPFLLQKCDVKIGEHAVPFFNIETMETNIENAFVIGTATGGTQIKFKIFIENCHEHIRKVVETIGKRLKMDVKIEQKEPSPTPPEQ
jgi:thioredoxin reductase (NADPH)